jgi:hypothetical protein
MVFCGEMMMNKPSLIIWVEGPHDYLFFDKLFHSELEDKFGCTEIKKYQEQKNSKVNKYLKSLRCMGVDILFITDMDSCSSIESVKEKAISAYSELSKEKIIVVQTEIESWYAAGLNQGTKTHTISNMNCTDNLIKETFDSKIPRGKTKLDYLNEIIAVFSIAIAKKKNRSFNYFCTFVLGEK